MSDQPAPHVDDRPGDSASGSTSDTRGFLADGAALGASALLTALVGLVGWLVAARTLPPADVGHASAFVNGFLLVAALAELGLGQAVLRWLPHSGSQTPRLVRRMYAATLTTCLVLGVLWALLVAVSLDRATAPLGGFWSTVLFVVAALGWNLFHLQDDVLTGVGAARWVPLENLLFGIARLALLFLLAEPLGALGIVLSWVIPTVVCTLVVNGLLALRAGRVRDRAGWLPDRREVLTTAGSVYLSVIGLTLLYDLVPLLVIVRFGAATGAVFFVIWMGVVALDLASTGFGSAMVVRLRGDARHLLLTSVRRVVPIFAVALLIALLAAEPLLRLFGASYAEEGTWLLRWIVLGCLFRLIVVLVASVHLGTGHAHRMAVIQAISTVTTLALVVAVPADDLGDVGVGFAVLQAVLALGAVLDLLRRHHSGDG